VKLRTRVESISKPSAEDVMSTRKPKLPLLYVEEQPALWLQAVTATPGRNAAALCKRQWRNSVATQSSPVAHWRLH